MHTPITTTDTALAKGIKTVGIGKKGSRTLEPRLIDEILAELASRQAPAIAQGAFFGALIIKGVAEDEKRLESAFAPGILQDPKKLTEVLAADAPDEIKAFCVRLLKGDTLSVPESEQLGDFLFSSQAGEGARGLAASILRVRYETADEYEGLLRSMQKTIEPPFLAAVPLGAPIVQLAEPFDGVDHSNLITPLVAQFIQRLGFRVISLVGRNSGPKFGNNLLDLARALRGRFLLDTQALGEDPPTFGWYANQQNFSHRIDQWVERRHQTIKRPFLSTLERFMNPFNAHFHISSAFHPPYGEKMLTICERAGYAGGIIARNGIEGSLAFPLLREAKILCTARKTDGSYQRQELAIAPEDYLSKPVKKEEMLDDPSLEKNRELIETYHQHGQTSNELFDMRIKLTCAGLQKALEWLKQNTGSMSGKD